MATDAPIAAAPPDSAITVASMVEVCVVVIASAPADFSVLLTAVAAVLPSSVLVEMAPAPATAMAVLPPTATANEAAPEPALMSEPPSASIVTLPPVDSTVAPLTEARTRLSISLSEIDRPMATDTLEPEEPLAATLTATPTVMAWISASESALTRMSVPALSLDAPDTVACTALVILLSATVAPSAMATLVPEPVDSAKLPAMALAMMLGASVASTESLPAVASTSASPNTLAETSPTM